MCQLDPLRVNRITQAHQKNHHQNSVRLLSNTISVSISEITQKNIYSSSYYSVTFSDSSIYQGSASVSGIHNLVQKRVKINHESMTVNPNEWSENPSLYFRSMKPSWKRRTTLPTQIRPPKTLGRGTSGGAPLTRKSSPCSTRPCSRTCSTPWCDTRTDGRLIDRYDLTDLLFVLKFFLHLYRVTHQVVL